MDASTRLPSIFYFQVDIVVVEVSIPFARCPLLFILALRRTVWGLMPRAVGINRVVLVSSGHDAAHRILASSVGEPTVKPSVSNKAAIVADVPKGAMLGNVVGVRKVAFGAFDTGWGVGALNLRFLRDVRLSSHGHNPTTDSRFFFVMQPGHRETVRRVSNSSVKDVCDGDSCGDGCVNVVTDTRSMCLPLKVGV